MQTLIQQLKNGDAKALARCITIVENELEGFEEILQNLNSLTRVPVIGITGPPGAGKSSIINELISSILQQNKRVGIIAVDPTSPFTHGSLLGDRIRMSSHFNNPNVYIRSLATRGALGGLSAKTVEIIEVMKNAAFDYIFVETVGVGQSEIEIVGLADTVVLVLVPEAGDEVQTIKSGIMEIAHIYVVNKSDREGSDSFVKNIEQMVNGKHHSNWEPPVIKTVAVTANGIDKLLEKIIEHQSHINLTNRSILFAEKAFAIIQQQKMKQVNKTVLREQIEKSFTSNTFNLYSFAKKFF